MIKYFIFLFILGGFSNDPSTKAPNFVMTTDEGIEVQLSDYEGQVVYISFWASWCGVCKRNFYKYENVRSTLVEKGVVLLNVSMDKEDADWKDAMEKFKIIGDHAIVNNYDEVKKAYSLFSLPGYEIVDKHGNLVYLSEGVNRDIFADFDFWLSAN